MTSASSFPSTPLSEKVYLQQLIKKKYCNTSGQLTEQFHNIPLPHLEGAEHVPFRTLAHQHYSLIFSSVMNTPLIIHDIHYIGGSLFKDLGKTYFDRCDAFLGLKPIPTKFHRQLLKPKNDVDLRIWLQPERPMTENESIAALKTLKTNVDHFLQGTIYQSFEIYFDDNLYVMYKITGIDHPIDISFAIKLKRTSLFVLDDFHLSLMPYFTESEPAYLSPSGVNSLGKQAYIDRRAMLLRIHKVEEVNQKAFLAYVSWVSAGAVPDVDYSQTLIERMNIATPGFFTAYSFSHKLIKEIAARALNHDKGAFEQLHLVINTVLMTRFRQPQLSPSELFAIFQQNTPQFAYTSPSIEFLQKSAQLLSMSLLSAHEYVALLTLSALIKLSFSESDQDDILLRATGGVPHFRMSIKEGDEYRTFYFPFLIEEAFKTVNETTFENSSAILNYLISDEIKLLNKFGKNFSATLPKNGLNFIFHLSQKLIHSSTLPVQHLGLSFLRLLSYQNMKHPIALEYLFQTCCMHPHLMPFFAEAGIPTKSLPKVLKALQSVPYPIATASSGEVELLPYLSILTPHAQDATLYWLLIKVTESNPAESLHFLTTYFQSKAKNKVEALTHICNQPELQQLYTNCELIFGQNIVPDSDLRSLFKKHQFQKFLEEKPSLPEMISKIKKEYLELSPSVLFSDIAAQVEVQSDPTPKKTLKYLSKLSHASGLIGKYRDVFIYMVTKTLQENRPAEALPLLFSKKITPPVDKTLWDLQAQAIEKNDTQISAKKFIRWILDGLEMGDQLLKLNSSIQKYLDHTVELDSRVLQTISMALPHLLKHLLNHRQFGNALLLWSSAKGLGAAATVPHEILEALLNEVIRREPQSFPDEIDALAEAIGNSLDIASYINHLLSSQKNHLVPRWISLIVDQLCTRETPPTETEVRDTLRLMDRCKQDPQIKCKLTFQLLERATPAMTETKALIPLITPLFNQKHSPSEANLLLDILSKATAIKKTPALKKHLIQSLITSSSLRTIKILQLLKKLYPDIDPLQINSEATIDCAKTWALLDPQDLLAYLNPEQPPSLYHSLIAKEPGVLKKLIKIAPASLKQKLINDLISQNPLTGKFEWFSFMMETGNYHSAYALVEQAPVENTIRERRQLIPFLSPDLALIQLDKVVSVLGFSTADDAELLIKIISNLSTQQCDENILKIVFKHVRAFRPSSLPVWEFLFQNLFHEATGEDVRIAWNTFVETFEPNGKLIPTLLIISPILARYFSLETHPLHAQTYYFIESFAPNPESALMLFKATLTALFKTHHSSITKQELERCDQMYTDWQMLKNTHYDEIYLLILEHYVDRQFLNIRETITRLLFMSVSKKAIEIFEKALQALNPHDPIDDLVDVYLHGLEEELPGMNPTKLLKTLFSFQNISLDSYALDIILRMTQNKMLNGETTALLQHVNNLPQILPQKLMAKIYKNPHISKELRAGRVDAICRSFPKIKAESATPIKLINALNFCIVASAHNNRFSNRDFSNLIFNEVLFVLNEVQPFLIKPLINNFFIALKNTKNLYLPSLKHFISSLVAHLDRFPPQHAEHLPLETLFEALTLLIKLSNNSKQQECILINICSLGNIYGASADNDALIRDFCDKKVEELVKLKRINRRSTKHLTTLMYIRAFNRMRQHFPQSSPTIRECIKDFCLDVSSQKPLFWALTIVNTQNYYFRMDPDTIYTLYQQRILSLIKNPVSLVDTIISMKLNTQTLIANQVYLPKVITTVLNGFSHICKNICEREIANYINHNVVPDRNLLSLLYTAIETVQQAQGKFPDIVHFADAYFANVQELFLLHLSVMTSIPLENPEQFHNHWELLKGLIFFHPQKPLDSSQSEYFLKNQLLFNEHVEIAPIVNPIDAAEDPTTVKLEATLAQIMSFQPGP